MDQREELTEQLRSATKNGGAAFGTGRRAFLKSGLALTAAAVLPFELLRGRTAYAQVATASPYGPLQATPCMTTGRNWLKLPPGFSYMSIGHIDDPMDDGIKTPGRHDGMGVCRVEDGRIYLVRNHEITPGDSLGNGSIAPSRSFAPSSFAPTYDSRAPGGTTNIVFDSVKERWESAQASLAGTLFNCSGGVTPWGSWLTCEELNDKWGKTHGFVFEVPTDGTPATGQPLAAMGRFCHEAVAVVDKPGDAQDGYVYMTEDNGDGDNCGFYRFRPEHYGDLSAGALEMLKIKGRKGVVMQKESGKQWDVEWVPVPQPTKLGVFGRGKRKGGAVFHKLEGAWYSAAAHAVWFTNSYTTSYGPGRIYKLDLGNMRLHMVYQPANHGTLDCPDNITVTHDGGLLICEDPLFRSAPRLFRMNGAGTSIYPLAELVLPQGTDDSEFTGPTWYGKWLFVNAQDPGITFAITGPWQDGKP